jgi:predicted RNA-binding Zn ribbon-like protein
MRFDGGHPALELVNTIYGQVGGPVEHDVLSTPEDLVTIGRRLGLAGEATPADPAALAAARALRDALDPVLRALLDGSPVPAEPREALEAAARAAVGAGELAPGGGGGGAGAGDGAAGGSGTGGVAGVAGVAGGPGVAGTTGGPGTAGAGTRVTRPLTWTWPDTDPRAPVHRLALAAMELLGDADALDRLRCCADCCWLFLDRSRGRGRRWCSMADCGTEAKKRRYVQKRRERRATGTQARADAG